jgi:hypothetical protein
MTVRRYIILSVLLIIVPANIYEFDLLFNAGEHMVLAINKVLFSIFILISFRDLFYRFLKKDYLYRTFAPLAVLILLAVLFMCSEYNRNLLPLYTLIWLVLLVCVIFLPRTVSDCRDELR